MNIRYSMIDSFIQCPRGFYNRYILNEVDDTKSSALEFGSAMHAALRAHFEEMDPYGVFNMYWKSIQGADMEYWRFSWGDLRDLANNKFIPNFLKLHSNKFSKVKIEESLEMPLSLGRNCDVVQHVLQGTFDICSDYNGVLTMTDWKTSTLDYKESKIMKNPQLYIYSALYRHKYGVLPAGVMYKVFVKSKGSIQTQFSPLTEEKLKLQMDNVVCIVKSMLNMLETKEFYSNYNCYCKECLK